MVKAYLRYEAGPVFGLVAGDAAVYDASGKLALSAALDSVIVWNVKQQSKLSVLRENEHALSAIATSPDGSVFATGASNGEVRTWDVASQVSLLVLHGHRRGVTAVCFDATGTRLASASLDNAVIVWDIVAEAGLYRLRGHSNAVLDICFLGSNRLASASRDTYVKVWDLETQHCSHTMVDHHNEVWTVTHHESLNVLLTGAADGAIRVWQLTTDPDDMSTDCEGELVGILPRTNNDRIIDIRFDKNREFFVVTSASKFIEVFGVNSEDEVNKRTAKRIRRAKRRFAKTAGEAAGTDGAVAGAAVADGDDADASQPTLESVIADAGRVVATDLYSSIMVIRASATVSSVDIHTGPSDTRLLATLTNNALEEFVISLSPATQARSAVVESQGHRSDVRDLSLSSDGDMVVSTSSGLTKVWNTATQHCIRTMESGFGLCVSFVPGNRHVIVGTKEGTLELFDTRSGACVDRIQAHEGAVWSLAIHPNGQTVMTGGADRQVKFCRSLQLADDVLSVTFSPDGKYVAAALLDSTVRIFFDDTLKFHLSLYGHKLPVLSVDYSSDNELIVTASSDKNIKIWGVAFGDCHKSIFAHDDSVMQVKFVKDTHYFFSVGKDGALKYWDGDKFEMILSLSGHKSEVWCCDVSQFGDMVVTGSHDRSLRIWNRTEEQLFLAEERELEMEQIYDAAIEAGGESAVVAAAASAAGVVEDTTKETLKAGERLIEALEGLVSASESELDFATMVLEKTLTSIRRNELERALLVIPFVSIGPFLQLLNNWLNSDRHIELCCRCLFFIVNIHYSQLVANRTLLTTIHSLRENARDKLRVMRDEVGFNIAAAKHVQSITAKTAEEPVARAVIASTL